MFFEWDETKRQANLAKHLIDFADAVKVFEGPSWRESRARCGPATRHCDRSDLCRARKISPNHFGQESQPQ